MYSHICSSRAEGMQVQTELWYELDGTGRKTKHTSVPRPRPKNSPAGKGEEVEFMAIPDLQTLSHMLAQEHWFVLSRA